MENVAFCACARVDVNPCLKATSYTWISNAKHQFNVHQKTMFRIGFDHTYYGEGLEKRSGRSRDGGVRGIAALAVVVRPGGGRQRAFLQVFGAHVPPRRRPAVRALGVALDVLGRHPGGPHAGVAAARAALAAGAAMPPSAFCARA